MRHRGYPYGDVLLQFIYGLLPGDLGLKRVLLRFLPLPRLLQLLGISRMMAHHTVSISLPVLALSDFDVNFL